MIDLHLHTTASDGRYSPAQLVDRVRTAGITAMSVTDHDTVAGLAEARGCAEAAGITFVDGIEITSVNAQRDVHVLGYFIDPHDAQLAQFLETQRASRVARVRAIGERLDGLGLTVDVDAILAAASAKPGVSVGRPLIARALVTAGHVDSISDAFERYLGTGQPAFVARIGQSPSNVVAVIHRAGGLASLAHPGVTRQPALIEPLVTAGLDAIEVFHSDHPPALQQDLLLLAQRLNLLVTGGSDYHGEGDRGRVLGGSTLPRAAFDRLVAAVDARRRAS